MERSPSQQQNNRCYLVIFTACINWITDKSVRLFLSVLSILVLPSLINNTDTFQLQ